LGILADIAVVLFEEGKINNVQKELLVNMAGFRNRLSHDYLGLDKNIIIDIVKNRIEDLYTFAKIIAEYVK